MMIDSMTNEQDALSAKGKTEQEGLTENTTKEINKSRNLSISNSFIWSFRSRQELSKRMIK